MEALVLKPKEFSIINGLDVKGDLKSSDYLVDYESLDTLNISIHPYCRRVGEFVLSWNSDIITYFNRIKIHKIYGGPQIYFISFYQIRRHTPKYKFLINEDIFNYINREISIQSILK